MIRLHVGGRKNIYKNTPVVRLINQVVALTLNLHHFSYEERPECTQVLEQWLQLRPNKQSPLTRWEYYRRTYGCNFFNQIISAGHTNGHGGPHVARGPRVGRACSKPSAVNGPVPRVTPPRQAGITLHRTVRIQYSNPGDPSLTCAAEGTWLERREFYESFSSGLCRTSRQYNICAERNTMSENYVRNMSSRFVYKW